MAGHWSRDLATLWWLDKGSARKRVSFHRDPAKLKLKYDKLYYPGIDAALYAADHTRIPLPPMGTPKVKAKRKSASKKHAPAAKDAVPDPVAA